MIFHIQNQKSNIICISNFYLQITKETKHKDTNITTEWSLMVVQVCLEVFNYNLSKFPLIWTPTPSCVTIWLHPPNL